MLSFNRCGFIYSYLPMQLMFLIWSILLKIKGDEYRYTCKIFIEFYQNLIKGLNTYIYVLCVYIYVCVRKGIFYDFMQVQRMLSYR